MIIAITSSAREFTIVTAPPLLPDRIGCSLSGASGKGKLFLIAAFDGIVSVGFARLDVREGNWRSTDGKRSAGAPGVDDQIPQLRRRSSEPLCDKALSVFDAAAFFEPVKREHFFLRCAEILRHALLDGALA